MFKTAISKIHYAISLLCLAYVGVNAVRGWYFIIVETKQALSEARARRKK